MPADATFLRDQARLRWREVHGAASPLRRGVPVVLSGEVPIMVLAAETASAEDFVELKTISGADLTLILAPARAAAILRASISMDATAVAITLPDSFKNIDILRFLADPLVIHPAISEVLRAVPTLPLSDAAICLAKIARLLPAVLAVPLLLDTAKLVA